LTSTIEQHQFTRDKATWVGYVLIGNSCFTVAALGPVMPYLRAEQGLNYTISSLHFSAWALGGMTAGAVGNLIIGKLGCSRAIWICGVGLCIAIAMLISVKLPAVTIGSALLGGVCASTMGQSIISIMSERFGSQRAIGITETNICGSLFSVAAPLVVGQFVKLGIGWRSAMVIPIVFLAVVWLASRKVFTPFTAVASGFAQGKLPVRYWFFWLVIWLSVACEWSIIFWTAEFLEKGKGLVKENAVQAVSVFLIAMVLGRVIGLKVMRMPIKLEHLLISVAAFGLIGFLIYWLATNSAVSLLGLAIAGLGIANLYPLSFSQAIASAEDRPGLAASRMSLSTGSAILTTPFVLGAIADIHGIHNAYAVVAVLMALAMVLLLVSMTRKT